MTYPSYWNPKGLREHLQQQQAFAPDAATRRELGRAINLMEYHRPTGPDGTHGERHTATCGCHPTDVARAQASGKMAP